MEKRHYYTPTEKREFLKIIKKYASIIENKGTDGDSARRKNIAWNRIACEYNTSSTAPYPATGKQMRRLWFNIKQRNKVSSVSKLELEPVSVFPTKGSLESDVTNFEDESSETPFVNVGESAAEKQVDSLKVEITGDNTSDSAIMARITANERRTLDMEFIDEIEQEESKPQCPENKDLVRNKNIFMEREYQDRRCRQNELHLIQKQIFMEKIREAKAKASLAELQFRHHQFLDASSKQLRRLWMNLKCRNKASKVLKVESNVQAADFPIGSSLDGTDVEEEISSTPYFVNVGNSENVDDSLITQITGGNTQQSESFITTDNEGRSFDVEFIDEISEPEPITPSPSQRESSRIKNNIIMREYQDRRRRHNELHMLQKRLLLEQLREAKAKASLAELELRHHQYLES